MLLVRRLIYLLPAGMLLYALTEPYSDTFYDLLRLIVCGASAWLAWRYYAEGVPHGWFFGMAAMAVIFNPVQPPHFDDDTWLLLDIAGAALMFAAWWFCARKAAFAGSLADQQRGSFTIFDAAMATLMLLAAGVMVVVALAVAADL